MLLLSLHMEKKLIKQKLNLLYDDQYDQLVTWLLSIHQQLNILKCFFVTTVANPKKH